MVAVLGLGDLDHTGIAIKFLHQLNRIELWLATHFSKNYVFENKTPT